MVEGWKNYCLKEIIDELIMGQSPDSSSYNNEEKGIAFIQGNADMQNGVPSIRMFTTDPKRYSKLNDILLSVRAPVGDVFYNNYGNLSIGRGLSAIRIKNKHLRTLVYYWLNFDKKQFERLEQGTTFTEIGKKEVRNINVTIPTNSKEQASIANILSSVDEAIESVKKSIEAAEKLKKSLMQNLLTGRMKPDGTLRTEEEFYEDEKFDKVPIGWEVCRFGRKIILCYGKSQKEVVSENGIIPVYGTGGVIEYATKSLCDHESVLVGRKGTIDKPCFINIPFWAVDTTYYVDSFIDGNMKYLYYILLRMNLETLNEATGVPSITRRTINRQKVLLPPLTEQNAIVETIEKIEEQINNKQTQITTLERLKKSLMQNLLTGKVSVGEGKHLNIKTYDR